MYETQNEYCHVYQQQLLYDELIMPKNKDYIALFVTISLIGDNR
jgi:hypothetical protein